MKTLKFFFMLMASLGWLNEISAQAILNSGQGTFVFFGVSNSLYNVKAIESGKYKTSDVRPSYHLKLSGNLAWNSRAGFSIGYSKINFEAEGGSPNIPEYIVRKQAEYLDLGVSYEQLIKSGRGSALAVAELNMGLFLSEGPPNSGFYGEGSEPTFSEWTSNIEVGLVYRWTIRGRLGLQVNAMARYHLIEYGYHMDGGRVQPVLLGGLFWFTNKNEG